MNTELLTKLNMLPPGSRVLCAVSGGADSMCLLHFLHSRRETMGIEVFCAHFDHGLRGDESDRDRLFVERFCRENGIDFSVGFGDVTGFSRERGIGTEEAARTLRYEFLEKTADRLGCDRIATAHNADDNAETVIFNLTRGTGLAGLCGIPPRRGRLIRPLLDVSRGDILKYLEENHVPHVEDSSNETDDYSRNIIRHRVMPVLRGINQNVLENILRGGLSLREDEEYLSFLAEKFIKEFAEGDALPAEELLALPRSVGARVLRRMCPKSLSREHIDAVFEILPGTERKCLSLPGITLVKEQGRLRFGKAETVKISDTALNIPGVTVIPGSNFQIISDFIEKTGEINSSLRTFYFNCDKICGTLYCGPRRDGDKVRLSGRGVTKSLKNLFAESGLTQSARSQALVFRDEAGVAAVMGFGTAERCAAGGAEREKILRIIIEIMGETNNAG